MHVKVRDLKIGARTLATIAAAAADVPLSLNMKFEYLDLFMNANIYYFLEYRMDILPAV